MTDKHGKILLVGFGPGSQEHMTHRARTAIEEADVVIGYSTYINLVRDLLDGKEVVRKGMTEEIDRCIEAWERARQGKTVALVSSGDIGIYGMAGPTYETLLAAGWTPDDGIEVEVIPGATALNAAASLIGAPLTHDFCAISLSDLLTPWPRIARRLEAAGRGDFVIALYNPKSGRRTRQIVEAQRILLRYRRPDTPVAIVKSAYRKKQDIQLVTLEEMTERKIGMLTTVLIGNSQTYARHGLMITPRGYGNKYDTETGAIREGEQAGRSLRMGLENWKACARAWLREEPSRTPEEAARHFDAPLGEILSAIAESEGDGGAGAWSAARVQGARIDDLLEAAAQWGRLHARVASGTGAECELTLEGSDLRLKDGWLGVESDHFRLRIDRSRVQQAWFVRRAGAESAVHFLDAAGEPVFALSLAGRDGRPEPGAQQAYDRAWQDLAECLA